MDTTIEFLDAVKAAQGLTSDYKLAKFLGVTQQSVNNYRQGKSFLCDETAIKVADCLQIYPALVLATIHAERAKGEVEKRAWKDLVKRLGGVAAALLLAVLALPSQDVYADGVKNGRENIYYVKSPRFDAQSIKIIFISLFSGFPLYPRKLTICNLFDTFASYKANLSKLA